MTEIWQDVSPQALARAVEDNILAYYGNFGRMSKAEVHRTPELTWFATGLPDELFNGVICADLPPQDMDLQIEAVLAQFARRNVPMLWHIGPSTRPADLAEHLRAYGLTCIEDEPGMALDMHTLNDHEPLPTGLTVELVQDAPTLWQWVRLWAGPISEDEQCVCFTALSRLGIGAVYPLTHCLGRLNGKPVATASLFLGAGIASVQHVVTACEARRRGIGRAMTLAVLREARARGYRVAVLTSSSMGRSVYQRIGFREYCHFAALRWNKQAKTLSPPKC